MNANAIVDKLTETDAPSMDREQQTAALISALRAKYPNHIIARCTNGSVGRWRMQRYLTGKGAAYTGVGKTVMRKILLAVYQPDFKLTK